ncbi:YacL family protein [Amphritea sp. HPY]|uniref:UPF0231 family protein n=1 Tax=Amphritea sp. HPY TaxID=3421652 RepID=UPI003D7CE01D
MDYEFTRDLCGDYCAEFSMGHEALGYWLSNELGCRQSVIAEIFSAIEQLQNRQCWEYTLEGAEYNLLLTRDDATIRAHGLDSDFSDDEPEEELDYYDQESTASCGLEDFIEILNGWQAFIAG